MLKLKIAGYGKFCNLNLNPVFFLFEKVSDSQSFFIISIFVHAGRLVP